MSIYDVQDGQRGSLLACNATVSPTTRPWYTYAKSLGLRQPVMNEPYRDLVSLAPVLTVSVPIVIDGAPVRSPYVSGVLQSTDPVPSLLQAR